MLKNVRFEPKSKSQHITHDQKGERPRQPAGEASEKLSIYKRESIFHSTPNCLKSPHTTALLQITFKTQKQQDPQKDY